MFASGNFHNFPIDDDISLASDTTMSSNRSRDSPNSFTPHREMDPTQPIDTLNLANTHDLCESLNVILSMPSLCDVTFLVGPALHAIYGLRAVMSTRSPVLHSLFLKHHLFTNPDSDQTNKSDKTSTGCFPKFFSSKKRTKKDNSAKQHLVISLPEHDPISFRSFVTYLHTGSVNIDQQNLPGILHLADTYKVPQLSKACWDFTTRCLTPQTVTQLLMTSQKYVHSPSVASFIYMIHQYIKEHASQIKTTSQFLSSPLPILSLLLSSPHLSPNQQVTSILSWAKRNGGRHLTESSKTSLFHLLDKVDFTHVTSKLRDAAIDFGYVPPMRISGTSINFRLSGIMKIDINNSANKIISPHREVKMTSCNYSSSDNSQISVKVKSSFEKCYETKYESFKAGLTSDSESGFSSS